MRTLLVLILLMVLVPDAVETVEAGVHLVASGHLAHWEPGESDLGDLGTEHGCGPLDHHCECCVAQAALTSSAHPAESPIPPTGGQQQLATDTGVDTAALPFRPPICA